MHDYFLAGAFGLAPEPARFGAARAEFGVAASFGLAGGAGVRAV